MTSQSGVCSVRHVWMEEKRASYSCLQVFTIHIVFLSYVILILNSLVYNNVKAETFIEVYPNYLDYITKFGRNSKENKN